MMSSEEMVCFDEWTHRYCVFSKSLSHDWGGLQIVGTMLIGQAM